MECVLVVDAVKDAGDASVVVEELLVLADDEATDDSEAPAVQDALRIAAEDRETLGLAGAA